MKDIKFIFTQDDFKDLKNKIIISDSASHLINIFNNNAETNKCILLVSKDKLTTKH